MTAHAKQDQSDGLLLPGLDGTNPLGFLAAMGVLVALDQSDALGPATLQWRSERGTWIPVVYPSAAAEQDELIATVRQVLCTNTQSHPALRWKDSANGQPDVIRKMIFENPDSWSACIGVEPLVHTDDSKRMSQLQTARKDYHVKAIENLLKGVDENQLRKTLFAAWDYAEPLEGLTLHIDPSEDRRHAHQWNQPAGDPNRKIQGNMIAANRLALEAFPLFPTVHDESVGQTVGFKGRYMNDTFWTWPLWSEVTNVHVIRSLLTLAELQKEHPSRQKLRAMGIGAVMRSQRILVGKTPNLTPAQQVA
jgi:CRISPR-associated endonuclease/helicase Cas3